MRLKEYTFRINEETVDALDKYEMDEDNPRSLTLIVNEFLENLMIDKGYLTIDLDEPELVHTPFEENFNPKDNFKRKNQREKIRLYYDDLDFSSHSPEYIDIIEDKLLAYSDGDYNKLFELSKNNSDLTIHKYKKGLYFKLGIKQNNDKIKTIIDTGGHRLYASINKVKYNFGTHFDKNIAETVCDFLNSKSDEDLINYSTKVVGLRSKKYRDWLYHEMEKEGVSINEQSDNIQ